VRLDFAGILRGYVDGIAGAFVAQRGSRRGAEARALDRSSSCVGTMFSISEDALASCSASVSIRMPWFGMTAARPLSSASARLAVARAFRTGTVSSITGGGSFGMA